MSAADIAHALGDARRDDRGIEGWQPPIRRRSSAAGSARVLFRGNLEEQDGNWN
jgi:hypothetical protein